MQRDLLQLQPMLEATSCFGPESYGHIMERVINLLVVLLI